MPFEKFCKPEKRTYAKREPAPPRVTILKKGLYFNPAAVEVINEDGAKFTRVILFFDKETDKLGMYFAKEGTDESNAFKFCVHKEKGCGMVCASPFIEHYHLTTKIATLGRRRFGIMRDKEEGMNDFFVAKLAR